MEIEDRIMRMQEVAGVTGLSSAIIKRMVKEGKFPVGRQLTGRIVGWLRSEVQAWIRHTRRADRGT